MQFVQVRPVDTVADPTKSPSCLLEGQATVPAVNEVIAAFMLQAKWITRFSSLQVL